jgi:glycosyltransferase involved in cell wall biosynthesis
MMDQQFSIPDVNKQLSILMVAPQPFFSPRGTPFSVLHRIKGLSLLGHSVDLLTYHIGENVDIENLKIYRIGKIPFVKKIKIGPSKTKLWLDFYLYLLTRKMLKQKQYDLLHTHEEACFWGVPLAKKYGLPHLYDMHSSLPQQLKNFKYTQIGFLLRLFNNMEKYAIHNSRAVITICPELQKYVESGFPDKTSVLIENVAENRLVFNSSRDIAAELRQRYNIPSRRLVLYYGTLEPYQGIDLLLESLSVMQKKGRKDVHFLLVGGSREQVNTYRQKAKSLNIDQNVTFTGFMAPQSIPSVVDMADLLVSPRLSGTNSPLKIYSYLRSEKPIVATNHITHTQIFDKTVAVLSDIEPTSFARAIEWVLDHPEKANQLAQQAKTLARERYSYEDYLQKLNWIVDQSVMEKN